MTDVARLEQIAQQLVARVREDDPQANQRWLHTNTTPDDREALLYVLAAAVPDDRSWRQLTAWCSVGGSVVRRETRHPQIRPQAAVSRPQGQLAPTEKADHSGRASLNDELMVERFGPRSTERMPAA